MAHQVIARSYYSRIVGQPRPTSINDMAMLSVSKLLWGCGPSLNFFFRLIKLTTEQEDVLWIADHKAIKHILHKSGYDYPKPPGDKPLRAMVTDEGLAWADGRTFSLARVSPYRTFNRRGSQEIQEGSVASVRDSRGEGVLACIHPCRHSSEPRPFFPPVPPPQSLFQLADRWANELSDKGTAGIVNVADGLMKVTLDAYVPSSLIPHWILGRAYLLSQYRIRHVVVVLNETNVLTRIHYLQPLLTTTLGR